VNTATAKALACSPFTLVPSALSDSHTLTAGEALGMAARRRQPRDPAATPGVTRSMSFPLC
jgi:hypothetical protein